MTPNIVCRFRWFVQMRMQVECTMECNVLRTNSFPLTPPKLCWVCRVPMGALPRQSCKGERLERKRRTVKGNIKGSYCYDLNVDHAR